MRISLFFAAALATFGCGSVSGDKMDAGVTHDTEAAGDFTLSVAPDTVDIAIASSTTVTFTVARTGAVGDITLAASNLPTGVTITFATNPLPVGTDTTDATIKVAGGSAAATGAATITGTAGGNMHTATLNITTHTITVAGIVAGNQANITVGLVGKSSVVSDSTGHFTFTDVTPPYDLYTYRVATATSPFFPTTMTPSIIFYDDLTRTDPVVRAAQDTSGFLILFQSTREGITGTRSGQGDNTHPSIIAWSNGNTSNGTVGSTGSWTFEAQWIGTQTTNTGTLFGLQWSTNAAGAPDQYIGFGSAPNITLTSDGNTSTNTTVNLTFVNPTEAGLVGTITPPSGYNAPQLQLNQQWGNYAVNLWTTSATTNATSSIVTGTTLGKACFFASATSTAGESSNYVDPALTAATDVSFTMPAAPVLGSPAANATGIDTSSDFTITANDGAVFVYTIFTSGTTRASYTIYSEHKTVRIPNVSERPLPLNQSFGWSVAGYGPTTVDDAATTADVQGANAYDFTGVKRYDTHSLSRSFTSKP